MRQIVELRKDHYSDKFVQKRGDAKYMQKLTGKENFISNRMIWTMEGSSFPLLFCKPYPLFHMPLEILQHDTT